MPDSTDLQDPCDELRSLHVRGTPLLLPNAWDAATGRAVEAAGFPVVATTSAGVANSLGYEDHEAAPAEEMLAAAGRISRAVGVPVTVDAEAGYGLDAPGLVVALEEAGAAGCNLEDSDHAAEGLRDAAAQADWLRAVRAAASERDYPLVINARIDVFVRAALSGPEEGSQDELVDEALARAEAYSAAGADCVYPIALWEADALARFTAGHPGPVNALCIPPAPSNAEMAEIGVARISWGGQLAHRSVEEFGRSLESIAES
jgi:2-methylisocitrate lyase-like PEP mutase family enzyme